MKASSLYGWHSTSTAAQGNFGTGIMHLRMNKGHREIMRIIVLYGDSGRQGAGTDPRLLNLFMSEMSAEVRAAAVGLAVGRMSSGFPYRVRERQPTSHSTEDRDVHDCSVLALSLRAQTGRAERAEQPQVSARPDNSDEEWRGVEDVLHDPGIATVLTRTAYEDSHATNFACSGAAARNLRRQ